jgi:7-keto-8-aminopelargonate synthetase-like enzyme
LAGKSILSSHELEQPKEVAMSIDILNSRKTLRAIIESQIDLTGLTKHHFRPELVVAQGQAVDSHVQIKGRRCLLLSGQDYLSLTRDSRVVEAGVTAMREYGVGALGSPIVTGTLDLHKELQKTLASFMKKDSAVVFTTGMLANIGCIPAIINSPYRLLMAGPNRSKRRAIFADENNHESLRMACDICEAHGVIIKKYRHKDYTHLNELMLEFGKEGNLVMTDTLFSMQGDMAPMREIVQVAESHTQAGRRTVIWGDGAHCVGILGANGRGVCELLGVEDDVIVMGVLSKAFGTLGGFVADETWLTDYLEYCATHMFSLSLPPAETAASTVAIRIVDQEPFRRKKLLDNANFLRTRLVEAGFKVLGDDTQIVFVVIGDETESTAVSGQLAEEGIICPDIKSPAVPWGEAGIRLTPTYNHTEDDLNLFLDKFLKIIRK